MEEKCHHNLTKPIISFMIIALIILSTFIGLNVSPTVKGTPPITSGAGEIAASATSNTSGKIVFGRFSPLPNYDEIRLLVRINGTAIGSLIFPENNGTMNWTGRPENATASYFDINPAGGTLSSGDYIEFNGLSPSTLYTFALYHEPSDSLVSLFGDNDFGTTPNPPLPSNVTFDGTFPSVPPIPQEKPSDFYPILILILSIIGLISTVIYLGWKLTT